MARVDSAVRERVLGVVRGTLRSVQRGHGPQGIMARTWPTGSMILLLTVLLAAYLVFYF